MGEKINPELELAIESSEYSRDNSLYLGYDADKDTWLLVLRYTGDIDDLIGEVINECVYLLGGFAVIKIDTSKIDILQRDSRVLYIDKANYYSYGTTGNYYEKYMSCISESFDEKYGLTGKGVCIGIIDSGLDIRNVDFERNGNTRVVSYWDQNMLYDFRYPNRYGVGRIYERTELSQMYLDSLTPGTSAQNHGTAVTSVAAGSTTGVAVQADIIMVEQQTDHNYPDTISIMMGIDMLVRYSIENRVPMVINLSYGNNYGAHDGTGLLEIFIDMISKMAKVSFVTGTGNDGDRSLHTNGLLGNVSYADLNITVTGGIGNFGLQIWKSYIDIFDVLVYSPSYELVTYMSEGQTVTGMKYGETIIQGISQTPSPYNAKQLIYIFFQSDSYIQKGIWKVRLVPKSIANGVYNAYLPGESYVTGQVYFENPVPFGSLTIPSTSKSVISVASYDQNTGGITNFSGRGYTTDNGIKPDIAAPGVKITVSAGNGMYEKADGTSLSTAFVSGAAALLMEWGIVMGNDPFMYGERLKAQLIRGARKLTSQFLYPNRYVGWGTLCLEESLQDLKNRMKDN